MFGKPIHLFTFSGFAIRLDPSWLILALLVTWSFAVGVFPVQAPGLARATYWVMGAAGAVGLFISIVVHEFFHAVVARQFNIPMRGITLFIFGGIAEMDAEPPSAKSEFLMAGAGPLTSVVLGVLLLGVVAAGGSALPLPIRAVMGYLGGLNLVLAAFNVVPAFPLDGGRMLRAALWSWKKDLRWATRIASTVGTAFGILLIVGGVLRIFAGDFIGGMWLALIGLFLRGAAASSYRYVLLRRALEGEPVSRFMTTQPIAVSPTLSVQELVDQYVYRYHHKLYPVVVDGGRLAGCVTLAQVKEVPPDARGTTTVGALAHSCAPTNTVPPQLDAMEALTRMRQSSSSRLLVADGDRLLGVVTLKDLLGFLSMKLELER
ncbi:MAG TPA: site-2 protease family protein [Gemmatimonadaceae bacterium]|nr:site-2 protease family protein [Gemmatimonadaceae bacterium]